MRRISRPFRVALLGAALVGVAWAVNRAFVWREEARLLAQCQAGRVWDSIHYLDATGRRPPRLTAETLVASIRASDVGAVRRCLQIGISPNAPILIGGDVIDESGGREWEPLSPLEVCEMNTLTPAQRALYRPGPEEKARDRRMVAIRALLWANGAK